MSVVRQLAQAVLVLVLLGSVVRLLAVAIGNHRQDSAAAADDRPIWIRDQHGGGVLPGGDVGGDRQVSESFSIRFHHRDLPGVLVTYCYYAAVDEEHLATITVERQTEYLVCTDPADRGGSELWSAYRYTTLPGGYANLQAATDAASQAAQAHLVWRGAVVRPATLDPGAPGGTAVMWTAIWTVLGFMLALAVLLFLGEPILAFLAEQLRERRAHRLALERERTKQAALAHQRDAMIWRELEHPATSSDPPSRSR